MNHLISFMGICQLSTGSLKNVLISVDILPHITFIPYLCQKKFLFGILELNKK